MSQEAPAGPGTFGQRIAQWCVAGGSSFSPGVAAGLAGVAARLDMPLRVAVAGRYGSGKSTLVDALLGRRVTRSGGPLSSLVVQYRYALADRAELVCHDSERIAVALTAVGQLPLELDMPASRVSYVDVQLDAPVLRHMWLTDLPGLRSGRPTGQRGAPAPIDDDLDDASMAALAAADAVLCVYAEPVPSWRAEAQPAARAVEGLFARLGIGRDNAIGVLTGIDRLVAPGLDPWGGAEPLAHQQATLFSASLGDVVPVAGRLAQTAACGLSAADRAGLQALAGVPGVGGDARATARALGTRREQLPEHTWQRLIDSFTGYGAAFAASLLAHTPTMTDSQLTARLLRASGLPRLRACLDAHLTGRSEMLKPRRAIQDLERLAAQCATGLERERLHDHLERLLAQWRY